jgi:glycine cleavage system H protein
VVPVVPNGLGSTQRVRIGLTSYAQDAVGALRFVALPEEGQMVIANEACGEVEASKAVSDVYSPVSGRVVAMNLQLIDNPGLVNQDPYGAGWICEIETELSDPISPASVGLLTAEQYLKLVSGASEGNLPHD